MTGVLPPTNTGRHSISGQAPRVLATVLVTVGHPLPPTGRLLAEVVAGTAVARGMVALEKVVWLVKVLVERVEWERWCPGYLAMVVGRALLGWESQLEYLVSMARGIARAGKATGVGEILFTCAGP